MLISSGTWTSLKNPQNAADSFHQASGPATTSWGTSARVGVSHQCCTLNFLPKLSSSWLNLSAHPDTRHGQWSPASKTWICCRGPSENLSSVDFQEDGFTLFFRVETTSNIGNSFSTSRSQNRHLPCHGTWGCHRSRAAPRSPWTTTIRSLRSAAASCCSMEALRMILGEKVDHILNINEYI